MSASAGLLWVLTAFSPWRPLYSPASPLLCIYNIAPVTAVRELICLNSNWKKKNSKIIYFFLLCQTFSLQSHMNFTGGMRKMEREGQAQDQSILAEVHLSFREILLKTLSMSQALGAKHVLSLSYSLYCCCCCFLLPSYLYNETYHSFCDYCISIQFKGSPSEL